MRECCGAIICKNIDEVMQTVNIAKRYGYHFIDEVAVLKVLRSKKLSPIVISICYANKKCLRYYLSLSDFNKKAWKGMLADHYTLRLCRKFSEENIKFVISSLAFRRLSSAI